MTIQGSSVGRWNDRAPINIDEVSIWDSALTGSKRSTQAQGQVTLYNTGVPSDLTSLSPIGWWLLGIVRQGKQWRHTRLP